MKNVSAWWTPPPPPNQTKVWEEVRRCSDQYAPAPGGALTGDEPSVGMLVDDLADETEGEVCKEEVVERLRHLYALRLISFEACLDA